MDLKFTNKAQKEPRRGEGESKVGDIQFFGRKAFIINSYYTVIDELKHNLLIRQGTYSEINDHSALWGN